MTTPDSHRRNDDDGFSLIELLVVVVIIGILIAIAIPLYLNYRKSANDKAAQSDLRGAVSTLEKCVGDNGNYPTSSAFTVNSANGVCSSERVNLSPVTTMIYAPQSGTTPSSYVLQTAAGSAGTGKYFCYDSKVGSIKVSSSAITTSATACP